MLRVTMDSTLHLEGSGVVEEDNPVCININTDNVKVEGITKETDPTVPEWAKTENKPTYTAEEVGALPDSTVIPTRLADLEEDLWHQTVTEEEKEAWSRSSSFSGDYKDLINKPENLSDFNNDEGFITTETDPTVPEWAKQPNKPSYTAEEVGALPDSTVIPTKVSELENDAGYVNYDGAAAVSIADVDSMWKGEYVNE